MLRRNYIAYVVIVLSVLIVSYALHGCKSKEEVEEAPPEYIDNVEIEIQLGNRTDLGDMDTDDIVFCVRNNGDRTIKELSGEVVFYDSVGSEVGRTNSIFISANPDMEGIAVQEKKARWRPLPSGQTVTTGYDVVYFFGGEPGLREKVKSHWDNITAEVHIKKLAIE